MFGNPFDDHIQISDQLDHHCSRWMASRMLQSTFYQLCCCSCCWEHRVGQQQCSSRGGL